MGYLYSGECVAASRCWCTGICGWISCSTDGKMLKCCFLYIYIHVTFVSCSVLFTCIVITVAHFVVKLCCLLLDHVWILVMVSRFDMHSRLDMAMAACIMSVSPTDRFNQSVRLVSLPPPPFTFSSRVCLSLSYKYSFCNAHFQSDLYGYTGLDKMFVTVIHESD